MEISVLDWFSVAPGIGFGNRGFTLAPRNPLVNGFETTFKIDYFTIAILVKIQHPNWKLRPFLQVDPEMGFLLESEMEISGNSSTVLEEGFNTVGMGLDFCLGVERTFGKVIPQLQFNQESNTNCDIWIRANGYRACSRNFEWPQGLLPAAFFSKSPLQLVILSAHGCAPVCEIVGNPHILNLARKVVLGAAVDVQQKFLQMIRSLEIVSGFVRPGVDLEIIPLNRNFHHGNSFEIEDLMKTAD